MSEKQRQSIYNQLTPEQTRDLYWSWEFRARPNQQLPLPDTWLKWLILAGRGWGKTRVGSEAIRKWVCGDTPLAKGKFSRIAIVAETSADARLVIVEGESGILKTHPPSFRPVYHTSKRQLTWPNGAIATLYNATEPDQLRGPQHDAAWCDELAKWMYARDTWDMLQFGLRLGDRPQQIITTTPRPIQVIKEILLSPSTFTTRGNTDENAVNLAPSFLKQIVNRYAGTRLGRQELNAEILDDIPGALWQRDQIEKIRIREVPPMKRVVVAIDPSGTDGQSDDAADVGIIAAGLGQDGKGYILADRTCNMSPAGWGRVAVRTYHELQADRIVAERNYGGAMVKHVILTTDKDVPYREVTASRGKWVRAEPIAALYEQDKIRHVGAFPQLEDEMCAFGPDGLADGLSPNRVDAMVWAFTELMLKAERPTAAFGTYGNVSTTRAHSKATSAAEAYIASLKKIG